MAILVMHESLKSFIYPYSLIYSARKTTLTYVVSLTPFEPIVLSHTALYRVIFTDV